MKKQLLFIYHSQSGHTERLINRCALGASKEIIDIKIIKALDATIEDVVGADGIIFGTPENFGTMSGGLKVFFDSTYDAARNLQLQKPFALIVSCETDGTGADRQVQTIATGYILKKVLETIIVKEAEHEQKMDAVEELGQTFAAGLLLGIF